MEESKNCAISIDKVSKLYPGRMALNEITFQVKKGAIHGFLGPNGAGKSTTMKILSGLIPPSSGEFQVEGKVGFLPENPPLYANMTVRDYLTFVCSIYQTAKVDLKVIENVMDKTGLSAVSDRLIGNLSKGFKQRVGIAQAIVHSPEIIILDEPTVGLDPVAIGEIRELIKSLKKDHTILFSSHQLHDVELLCSEITLINHGEIVVSGPLDKIVDNLKTRLTLRAQVEHFNTELLEKLKASFKLEDVKMDFDAEKNQFELVIVALSTEKIKKEIAKFLTEDNIGLLEFIEVKMDLEDLFRRMIKK